MVPLRALDVDVDVRVIGLEPDGLAAEVRGRWHLALRDDAASYAGVASPALPQPAPLVIEAGFGNGFGSDAAEGRRASGRVVDDDLPRLLMRLTHAVTNAVIHAQTGTLLMLHAAALCHPVTGAAAVCVAPGNTGKSTLCVRLGPRLRYLTDETVGIYPGGSIAAYPKPISTRRPDWPAVKDEVAPADPGLDLPEVTPWVVGVVLLRRLPEHRGRPRVEVLSTLDAVVALTPESSGFMGTDRPLAWVADLVERTGGARRVTYTSADDLEPLLSEITG